MNDRYLPTYLNDHLAGSVVGSELSKRAAASNEGTAYGAFLSELAHEVAEDKATLELMMERLGIKQDRVKMGGAYVGEKLGRLKPNAHLTGYSPLSRVVELEMLTLGVTGKRGLWRALRNIADTEESLDGAELDVLIERAESQLAALEPLRLKAVAEALTGPEPA